MGIYNEVFKKCPICNETCEIRVSAIARRFESFDLDRPERLGKQLNQQQLYELKDLCDSEKFRCDKSNGGCGNTFELESNTADRIALAKKLFGEK